MERAELLEQATAAKQAQKRIRVHCCTSTGCQASQSVDVKKQLDAAIKTHNLDDTVEAVGVGCMGFCGQGPMVEVEDAEAPSEKKNTIRKSPPNRLIASSVASTVPGKPTPSKGTPTTPSSAVNSSSSANIAAASIPNASTNISPSAATKPCITPSMK